MKDHRVKIDWGECAGCELTGMLLTPFIHQPTKGIVYLCGSCTENAIVALEKGQVPGMLDKKVKEWAVGK